MFGRTYTDMHFEHCRSLFYFGFIIHIVVFGALAVLGLQHGVCHRSDDVIWFYDVTPDACKEKCQARQDCTSVIMHVETHMCYLNMGTSGRNKPCLGFEVFNKNEHNMAMTPECSAARCDVTQTCETENNDVSCAIKDCPAPPILSNGHVLGNQRFVGARIQIKCDNLYVLVGPTSLTCYSNGKWESDIALGSQVPKCIEVCQAVPLTLTNGQVIGNPRLVGDRVTFQCDNLHVLVGPTSLTCQSNGIWESDITPSSQMPQCIQVCQAVPLTLTNGQVIGNPRLVGDRVTFKCDNLYVLVGPTSLTCRSNDLWESDVALSSQMPQCIQECQAAPLTLTNGQVIGNPHLVGDRVTFQCDNLYVLVGPTSLACPSNGLWESDVTPSSQMPQCILVCPFPPEILHGSRKVTGSIVDYSCSGDFKLVGSSRFHCYSNGNWIPDGACAFGVMDDILMTSPPRCVEEKCVIKQLSSYHVYMERVDFATAAQKCTENKGHLFSFTCKEEFEFVRSKLIHPYHPGVVFMVGLNDLDIPCQWTWHNSPDESTFTSWAQGEPNNYNNHEHCVLIFDLSDDFMNDCPCYFELPFICESD